MYDTHLILQANTTKATSFSSTGVDIKTGTPRRGMTARFLVTSHRSIATAGAVWRADIEVSADNTVWESCASSDKFTSATAAAGKEVFVPFITTKRYIRSTITLVTSAGTPEIIYNVDLGIAFP